MIKPINKKQHKEKFLQFAKEKFESAYDTFLHTGECQNLQIVVEFDDKKYPDINATSAICNFKVGAP